ncbi:AAA family ATPase [Bacillus thuringiensis]|uniref:AAA family ATPase n=1 Tax=Bacillus thuringiensis TaxID=1428 RepID=UPI0039882032
MTKVLMFQGVGANAGKTVFTRSLVRLLSNLGMKVSPFKPVSVGEKFEEREGLFLDARMWVLTEAARCTATQYHAPIQIIKNSNNTGQLFIGQEKMGEVEVYAKDIALLHKLPQKTFNLIKETIKQSYEALLQDNDVIIIEGAGSPIDLGNNDIPNYYTASISNAPIVLIGSVSAGGSLASLHGTLLNFPEDLRQNIIGFALNGLGFGSEIAEVQVKILEDLTGIKWLGSFPHCSIYDEIPLGQTSSLCNAEAEYEYLCDYFEDYINTEEIFKEMNLKIAISSQGRG